MYELPSSFCPYEVGVGIGGAQFLLCPIAVRVGEGRVAGAALRQAHVGIISIEQILAALVVLDMKGAERRFSSWAVIPSSFAICVVV